MIASPLLLDTNVVIRLETNEQQLPPLVLQQIKMNPVVYLSAVTAWEVSIKQGTGKLSLSGPVSYLIRVRKFTELPITIAHSEAVRKLPLHYRDPFDRMLVAQALVEGLTLVTSDRMLAQYSVPVLLV